MPNIGKAITQAGQGFVQGREIYLNKQKLELLKKEQQDKATADLLEKNLRLIQSRIDDKKVAVEEMKANTERMKGATDLLTSFAGVDLTPNQVQSFSKIFQNNFQVDLTPMFNPEKDEKSGVVKSFKFDTTESLQKQIQQRTDQTNAETAKLNAASASINAKTAHLKALKGDDPAGTEIEMIKNLQQSDAYKTATPEKRNELLLDMKWSLPAAQSKTDKPGEQGTRKDIEADMFSSVKQLDDLKIISETFSKDYLKYGGKIKQGLLDMALKSPDQIEKIFVSEEDRAFVRGFSRFQGAVLRTSNRYVNEISGAQFSIEELKRYEKSLFNKDQNYESFQANYNDYTNHVKQSYRIKDYALRKGLQGEEIGKEIDRLMMLGEDPTVNPQYSRIIGLGYMERYKAMNPKATDQQAKDWATIQLYNQGFIK